MKSEDETEPIFYEIELIIMYPYDSDTMALASEVGRLIATPRDFFIMFTCFLL